jgi:hypothetical protein
MVRSSYGWEEKGGINYEWAQGVMARSSGQWRMARDGQSDRSSERKGRAIKRVRMIDQRNDSSLSPVQHPREVPREEIKY